MCGIAGWVTTSQELPDEAVVRRMCDAIRHRGPDSDGYHVEPGVALGVRRLRIIDLVTGDQPISSPDGSICIVFNGEIYNFQELRSGLERRGHQFTTQGDTEVVIHAYEEAGERCLEQLNGMFALALWDSHRGRLLLARDRLGKKPLQVAPLPGGLAFASEFQALLQHPGVPREVEPLAIDYFLSLGYVPGPMSAFNGIQKLEPGEALLWERDEIKRWRYWDLNYAPKLDIGEDEAADEFRRLFRDSVRLRLISDVPLGAFLSGGIDSSSVVAAMAAEASGRVKTFSIGFADRTYNELPEAQLVAERFGTDHHEFVVEPDVADLLPTLVRHYGEPYADSSALPTYELARMTRGHVTVALNGDGGDELFGGYDRYRALLLSERLRNLAPIPAAAYQLGASALPAASGERSVVGRTRRFLSGLAHSPGHRYAGWIGVFDDALKESCLSPEFRQRVDRSVAAEFLIEPIEQRNGMSLLDATLKLDTTTYLPYDLLVKVDIASMANSLESRSPFLDYRLVEWAARLRPDLKVRGGASKYLLKRAMRGIVPAPILRRKKAGFGVPIASWLRSDLRGMLEDLVLSDLALGRGYFEPAVIRDLVDDHVEGRADYAPQLWALLVLELWHQTFIDGAPAT